MAGVAEEGVIATEAPVDVKARAERFRQTIEGNHHARSSGAHKVELEMWRLARR